MTDLFNPDAPMRTCSVQLLIDYAKSHKISPQWVLKNSGLTQEECYDVNGIIRAWQELQIIRNLREYWEDDLALGFDVGKQYLITSYGMWGLAMMTSRTLGDAAKVGIRYLDIASRFNHVSLRAEKDHMVIGLNCEHLPKDIQRFMVGRDLASIAMMHQGLMREGNNIVSKVILGFQSGDYPRDFNDIYACEKEHSRNCHEVWIEKHWYAQPVLQSNESTSKLCIAQCEAELERLNSSVGISGKVKQVLWEQISSTPSMESTAQSLHMSPRSLRRQLESEGTGWRELMALVRMQKAERLLADTDVPVQEIAFNVGYSDRSSFSHAFKRVKRVSPESYRQMRQEKIAV